MTLKLEDKKAIVAELSAVAKTSLSAVAVDYRGLTVAEVTELRMNARKTGVYMRVIRNTLARLALKDTEFACLDPVLIGPVFLAFSLEDPGAAARLMRKAAEQYEKLSIRGVALGGELYNPKDIAKVADLPTRDQALSQLMATMQAPVSQMARTVVETYAQLARVVAAVRDQKQAG